MTKAQESYNRFVVDNHEYINKKDDFKKMCKKWGIGYIQYLQASYQAYLWDLTEIITETEWKDYNGVSDSYYEKLKTLYENGN